MVYSNCFPKNGPNLQVMAEQEGVIKYQLDFARSEALPDHDYAELNHWHQVFKQAGILGQNPERYDGLGFGNLSQRLDSNRFLISGTQTGELPRLEPQHYAMVTNADIQANRIVAEGLIKPSSESLTHAAIYALNPAIHFIFHAHSPDIWLARRDLAIAETSADVPYGTPAMAIEMERIYQQSNMQTRGVIAMAGHEDGIISFAATADEAGRLMMDLLARATR